MLITLAPLRSNIDSSLAHPWPHITGQTLFVDGGDQKVGLATRQAFINNHADRDVLILGTHFPTLAVGHIVRDGERWRFTPVKADVS